MSNSINTNTGSMLALQSLRTAQSNTLNASKQIQTGYRVADAADDAAVFSVSQQIRADVQSWSVVVSSLANAIESVSVAIKGLEAISDIFNEMSANDLAWEYADNNQRSFLENKQNKLKALVRQIANGSNFNGQNFLSQPNISVNVLSDPSGAAITISSVDTTYNTVTGVSVPDLAPPPFVPLTFTQRETSWLNNKQRTAEYLGYFSERMKTLEGAKRQALSIIDAQVTGLGAIVDADIGKAQAAELSAKAKTNLAIESVGIANSSQRAILGFLEGIARR